jgi:thioredoxin-related protein
MVFVSTLPENIILSFLKEIDFQPMDNMFFLRDKKAEFAKKIDVKTIPSVFIYNRKGQLMKRYAGFVKTETLLKHLSQE